MDELCPPSLGENDSYDSWRSEIQMWQITTTMEPKRQALAVRTKLHGKARELALKLDAADLNTDGGMSFLLDTLDSNFRKKPRKWDVEDMSPRRSSNEGFLTNEINNHKGGMYNENQSDRNSLSAAERARQRAAQLSAKLAAEGKYQTQPMSLLPKSHGDQFNKHKLPPAPIPSLLNIRAAAPKPALPEVKKLENGNSFAEYNINDECARPFLTRGSTRDLIAQQSGAAISLRGRFLTKEDKRQAIITGINEKPLCLMVQANIAAKVQVALHKIMEVCRNYEKFGADNNFNNYGLSINAIQSTHHFVHDKLFVGLDNAPPDFNLKEKLSGENGANFSFMVQQTGAKVFLRGRGSGYLEPNSGRESFEALHIYISHPRQDGLDMARQLCESLIETIKKQHEEWEYQRVTLPVTSNTAPPYGTQHEIRYPTYPSNEYTSYPSTTPSLMSQEHVLPKKHKEESQFKEESFVDHRHPGSHSNETQNTWSQSSYNGSGFPTERPTKSYGPNEDSHSTRPQSSYPENDPLPPQSNFKGDGKDIEDNQWEERVESYRKYQNLKTEEDRRFQDMDRKEKHSDRSRKKNRDQDNHNHSRSRSRSKSPERKRSQEYTSRRKESRKSHKDSPHRHHSSPIRGDSPNRRYSPTDKKYSSNNKQESPPMREQSPPKRSSPPRRKSSPHRREEHKKRRFTEEPKKRRKFSEDPWLLEQVKAESQLSKLPEPEREVRIVPPKIVPPEEPREERRPKLQFRSEKNESRVKKSVKKMPPPPMLPVEPKKANSILKNIKISPAGLAAKKNSKNVLFKPPPSIETLKPPIELPPPPVIKKDTQPQGVLKMGALSSLSMYEGDSDED